MTTRWKHARESSDQSDGAEGAALYFAFLRAINVGRGRTVKMESLRGIFASLGY